MAKTGRPQKEIDKTSFESLLKMQCTLEEIAGFFNDKLGGCSTDTIERWCKRTYKESFADISKKWRSVGKISLRRYQFKIAEHNASMAIWLGKQYLGQRDSVDEEADNEATKRIDEMIQAIKEEADNHGSVDV